MAGSAALGTEQRSARKTNPLFRRTVATGVVGAAVTASTLLGAGSAAAAGSVVIESCTGTSDSSAFGQPIVASPSALDDKVEQATLLAYPLRFDLAKQAREEFLTTGTVELGAVTEDTQTFSGQALADAFTSRVSGMSTISERSEDVNNHMRNLAILGCPGGARVPGQDPPPPPPPPEPEKPTSQPAPPPETSPSTSEEEQGAPPPSLPPFTGFGAYPGSGAPSAVRAVPPDWAYAPGTLPPWARSQFGQVPGLNPDVGRLLPQPSDKHKQARDEEVREAGNAESMPADVSKRVALPVLIGAIALALVTAALVRTWVLRRD